MTWSSLKGVSNRALFAYKNGRFPSSFLLLGIAFLEALKKANVSFKSPSPKPHLNRTGSVFALPKNADLDHQINVRQETGAQTQTSGFGHMFRWGGGLPQEGVGALKTVTSLNKEARIPKFHFS